MSRLNVKCPICGYENEGVDLEETGGRAECYGCGADLVFVGGQSRAERAVSNSASTGTAAPAAVCGKDLRCEAS